ncbi:unnamed protein product [Caenorhabditis angaria]|uniref:DUF19 domain-containing protein n=1 Tax=Caenorhabditis angaria TaxID=860376 RepID=A0A9P1I445_9PELO|nr:unnamed protein product [Caenorhabditis angaria]
MVIRLLFLLIILINYSFCGVGVGDISIVGWGKATNEQLQNARIIGMKARQNVLQIDKKTSSPFSIARDRKLIYLDGLQQCNQIDDEKIAELNEMIIEKMARNEDSKKLERIGLTTFFAKFVTLPKLQIKQVVDFACAKHEQQLECGLQYEGRKETLKRIEELKMDGANKLMFEKECVDESFAPNVYPCIGESSKWIDNCEKEIDEYQRIREKINDKIERIYDAAVETVKFIKDDTSKSHVFHGTMKYINYSEGSKCLAFKQMRLCLLSEVVKTCGHESAKALNTTLSVGYLRNERSERLQMDFETFDYPGHQFCDGL